MPIEDRPGADVSYPAVSAKAWLIGDESDALFRMHELPQGFSSGDFLVGGLDCGVGADRRIRDLQEAGVAGIIARSFAPFFFREARAIGLPAMAIEEAPAIQSGDSLRVDIESYRVVNHSSGDRYVIRNLTDADLEHYRTLYHR